MEKQARTHARGNRNPRADRVEADPEGFSGARSPSALTICHRPRRPSDIVSSARQAFFFRFFFFLAFGFGASASPASPSASAGSGGGAWAARLFSSK